MTVDMKRLPTLRLGSTGRAVVVAKQGVHHWNAKKGNTTPVYGIFFRPLVKQFQEAHGIPQSGVIGPATWADLMRHIPATAKAQLPQIIFPGSASLHPSLWEAQRIGFAAGLSDLGTYNPASRLPSGRLSDHAVYPAYAFDLGIEPDTGWDNLKARAYVQRIVGRPEIEYVILGNRIWTRRGFGSYTAGGHGNHVHVSGVR